MGIQLPVALHSEDGRPCRAGAPAELAQQGSGLPRVGTWRPWGCPCRLSSTVLFLPLALSTCCTDHAFLSDQ